MNIIDLGLGRRKAWVSDADHVFLSQDRWTLNSEGFVVKVGAEDVFMHLEILKRMRLPHGYHYDGNTLNNQRHNLVEVGKRPRSYRRLRRGEIPRVPDPFRDYTKRYRR